MFNYDMPDPSWKEGPEYEPECGCIYCDDKEELVKCYREEKAIAAKALGKVLQQLYTDATFDKVALNSAIESLCQELDIDIPHGILTITRKKMESDHEYFQYMKEVTNKYIIQLKER